MIELNKFIKKFYVNSIWDKLWYTYTVAKIIYQNEIEIRWNHIFLTWIALQKYDFNSCFVKTRTKTTIKNNFFYTLTK